jgi:hypothetical protein
MGVATVVVAAMEATRPGYSPGLFFEGSALEFHPVANVFPLMEGDELKELVEDIKKHGQQQPILTYEGKILDGRNRYRACMEAGEEPWVESWHGDSPVEAVKSFNLHRRHLTASQKAAAATELEEFYAKEARRRREANLKRGADSPEVAKMPQRGKARDQAAADLRVSPRYVSDAKKLKREDPEAFEAVKRNEKTLPQAMKPYKQEKPKKPAPEPTVGELVGSDFSPPPRELTKEQNNFYETPRHVLKLRKLDPEKQAAEWLEVKDDGVSIGPHIRDAAFAKEWYASLEAALEKLEKQHRRETGNLRVVGGEE